tara:strand:- start:69 stop:536 length:468 start_codon:yes stop_codon:yes gene_type:complete
MEHNFEHLSAHILPLSDASTFSEAKNEWKLVGVAMHEELNHCPCGKQIKELCHLKNKLNRNKTFVGNVCVNQFLGIETGNLFAGLKRIALDDTANANEDLIRHAYDMGYIYSEQEYNFLMQTKNKRNFSLAQLSWKQKINRRIVKQTVVGKWRAV